MGLITKAEAVIAEPARKGAREGVVRRLKQFLRAFGVQTRCHTVLFFMLWHKPQTIFEDSMLLEVLRNDTLAFGRSNLRTI